MPDSTAQEREEKLRELWRSSLTVRASRTRWKVAQALTRVSGGEGVSITIGGKDFTPETLADALLLTREMLDL